ncbi:hypothetical protein [Alteribacillus bidgolensis]|uniref:Uncharacterized protein n=1 Tax=Alteribacillus bidgolensis TaxID=930129 RepID=A0A1G8DYT2_9BACI|nr:hypothetical protein [Alteribacillus bidgolensis]SDH62807.1 hypothetical protein SAMN05216352_10212 [Alteribacillus bidgolensis]
MAVSQAFLALNRKLAAQKEREEDLNKVREVLNRSTKSIESKKKNSKRFTYPNNLLVKLENRAILTFSFKCSFHLF